MLTRYLQRLIALAPLSKLEEAQKLSNQLQFELMRANEDRQRILAELAEERGAHLKEIKQLANYVTVVFGQMPVFPDIPHPEPPAPEESPTDILATELRARAEERHKKRNILDDVELAPGKGHPIAQRANGSEHAASEGVLG